MKLTTFGTLRKDTRDTKRQLNASAEQSVADTSYMKVE